MLKCVAAIISTVLAFVAIFNFIDAIIAWFLGMLNIQNAGLSVSIKILLALYYSNFAVFKDNPTVYILAICFTHGGSN